MGDPVLVGTELDRIHRPKLEWSMIILIGILSFARFAIQYFFKDVFYPVPLLQNMILLLVYMGIMILFYRIDFTGLASYCKVFYAIYITILFSSYFLWWPSGYFLSMDLSEPHQTVIGAFTDIYYELLYDSSIKIPVLIYFFPVILVGLLYRCRGKSYKAILLCCCSVVLPIYFCYYHFLKIPCIIITAIALILITISIIKNWFAVKKPYAIFLVCITAIFAILFMHCLNENQNNIYEYMKHIQGILQNNIKNSCLIGEGSTHFMTDGLYTEYFPAYLLHYAGWLILLPILAIYFFFMIRAFLLLKKQKSQLGFMTATAILLTFFAISTWNLVANTGIFVIENPLGIPFFSTSDSINIVFFALMGILLSVFRTGEITTDKYIKNKKDKKCFISISENKINICISIPFKKKIKKETI